MRRKCFLAENNYYHIYSKSIAGYNIFNEMKDYARIIDLFKYYQRGSQKLRFSWFIKLDERNRKELEERQSIRNDKIVDIIAYCIMPTHIHLILKQEKKNGISMFMSEVLNSYARYFNEKNKRKGPLWEGRFKNVLIKTERYLLHLTRYIHLNPVTARIIDKPEEWTASSYNEYMSKIDEKKRMCNYHEILNIS